MSEERKISAGRKFWEIINPLVFFMVCMAVSTLAVVMVITTGVLYSGADYDIAVSIATRSTIIVDLCFYSVTILVKYKSLLHDKFKYKHVSAGWPVWKLFLSAAAVVAIGVLLNIVIGSIGLNDVFTLYNESAQTAFSGVSPLLLIITVVIIGPIAEEMIFRYLIFGRIRFYFNSKWAIIVSSLLFGAYHLNIIQLLYGFCFGIVLAWIYDKCGNIWITIIPHMIINFIVVLQYI